MTNPKRYFIWCMNAISTRYNRKLFSINLEVTKRCNAKCGICNYWQTKDEVYLHDYLPLIQHLNPLAITLTGGEPLLREDIIQIVSKIKNNRPLTRLSLISNGILLTPEIGKSLKEAGLDQLSISLDFLDERHDNSRGHKGLFQHIIHILPKLKEMDLNVCINTVIMKDNLNVVCEIPRWAKQYDVFVNYSCYSDLKTGKKQHMLGEGEFNDLMNTMNNLIRLKRSLGNISNSNFYLKNIPIFFRYGKIDGCKAGLKWIQVTPDGNIKRCSERPIKCDWKEYTKGTFSRTECDKCWFACRGESQAPLELSRLKKYGKHLISNFLIFIRVFI